MTHHEFGWSTANLIDLRYNLTKKRYIYIYRMLGVQFNGIKHRYNLYMQFDAKNCIYIYKTADNFIERSCILAQSQL